MTNFSIDTHPHTALALHVREVIEKALAEAYGVPISLEDLPHAALGDEFLESLSAHLAAQIHHAAEQPHAGNGLSDTEPHPRNRLNDLSGAEWLWFTKSVLRTTYPSILGHHLRKRQGGNKPPQLMEELITFFTKHGQQVLDPFGGAGGTALGAYLAGRDSISIEINPVSIEIYHAVCREEMIVPHPFIQGDCRQVLRSFAPDSIDFIATDPPYSPELKKTMSTAGASLRYGRTNRRSGYISYSDDSRDLSKCTTFDAFFEALDEVGHELLRVLRPRRYMVMILRDAYQDGEYIQTSALVAQRFSAMGWTFKGQKIWYNTGSRIRPYGYPSAFVPNIVHQNILIFRKE